MPSQGGPRSPKVAVRTGATSSRAAVAAFEMPQGRALHRRKRIEGETQGRGSPRAPRAAGARVGQRRRARRHFAHGRGFRSRSGSMRFPRPSPEGVHRDEEGCRARPDAAPVHVKRPGPRTRDHAPSTGPWSVVDRPHARNGDPDSPASPARRGMAPPMIGTPAMRIGLPRGWPRVVSVCRGFAARRVVAQAHLYKSPMRFLD